MNELDILTDEIQRLRGFLDENGIIYTERQCDNKFCENKFLPKRNDQKYCSDVCKNRARQQRYREKLKKRSV